MPSSSVTIDENFDGSTVLITGGTGSFGSTMAKSLLNSKVAEVRIFSRDESKQDSLRRELSDPRAKFILGDIRDFDSIQQACRGANFVFHAAALKQVPSCEFFPQQAVATNVAGSHNLLTACGQAGVSSVVSLSTDKAVFPINVMGMTKALMEKSVQAFARNNPKSKTVVSCVRYGNVIFSRGSVIPLFMEQLEKNEPLTLTDPEMTRFLMTLDQSISLVKKALSSASPGDLFVKDVPSATVINIAQAISEMFEKKFRYQLIGVRHGEKKHEVLLSSSEFQKAEKNEDYFCVPLDDRDLNYKSYTEEGSISASNSSVELSSASARQLSVVEIKELLMLVPQIHQLVVR